MSEGGAVSRRSMPRLVALASVAFVGIAALPTAAAVSPSPGLEVSGQRIELQDHDVAITFPSDWSVHQLDAEGLTALIRGEPPPAGLSLLLKGDDPHSGGSCLLELDDPSVWREPTLLATYAIAAEQDFSQDPAFHDVGRTRVQLSAGPGWRIEGSGEDRFEVLYLLRGRDRLVGLACDVDGDPPSDHWSSIAETIEFLSDTTPGMAVGPMLGGGRIERPADGFAITFPDDWMVEEVGPDMRHQCVNDCDPEGPLLQRFVVWADQPAGDGACTVIDFTELARESPPWETLVEATEGRWLGWKQDPTVLRPGYAFMDLPAGRTGLLRATDKDGSVRHGYVFTDAEAYFLLECWSAAPPDDRWLSIAETFEYLPEQE